jgi:hypothetical protein
MSFLRTLRKLVLGETWTLPVGVAVALGAAALVRVATGGDGWWREGGGVLLAALLVAALAVSLRRALR